MLFGAAVLGLFTSAIWGIIYDPFVGDTGGLEPFVWGIHGLRLGLGLWLAAWLFPTARLRVPRMVLLVAALVGVVVVMNVEAFAWASRGGNV